MGFENNFNGIYFHHDFYLKTGVSRNDLSPGYSEQDTSSVCGYDDVMDSWKNIQMCKYKIFILNLSFAMNEFMQQVLVHDFKKK